MQKMVLGLLVGSVVINVMAADGARLPVSASERTLLCSQPLQSPRVERYQKKLAQSQRELDKNCFRLMCSWYGGIAACGAMAIPNPVVVGAAPGVAAVCAINVCVQGRDWCRSERAVQKWSRKLSTQSVGAQDMSSSS